MNKTKLNELLISHEWKLLESSETIKWEDLIKVECSCGRQFNYTLKKFKNNKNKKCKECSKPKNQKNINDVRKIIEDKGGKLLDTSYKNVNTPIKILTSDNKEEYRTLRTILKSKALISKDKMFIDRKESQRNDIENIKRYFNRYGLTLKTTEYINNYQSLDVICKCGKEFTTSYAKIKMSKHKVCWECYKQIKSEISVNDISFVKNTLEKIGYKMLDDYVSSKKQMRVLCSCGNETSVIFNNVQRDNFAQCPKCKTTSSFESEVRKFIENIYSGKILYSVRKIIKPYEIDIYLPDLNIAFECNGIYWHSEKFRDKDYHINKTLLCEKMGIRLLHIDESNWVRKNEIIKDIIKKSLGITNKIFARKCIVKEIEPNVSKKFLEKNHIQGNVNCNINYGLYHENELISVMTMSKARFNKKTMDGEYELYRFANKLSYSVIGGFTKLLKNIIKDKKQIRRIKTFCDISIFSGKIYEDVGFKYNYRTKPNYKYFNPSHNTYEMINRMKFQKHKLKKNLKNYDKNISSYENIRNNGYLRIWDCGNKTYTMEID
jgi:hypothetical protein